MKIKKQKHLFKKITMFNKPDSSHISFSIWNIFNLCTCSSVWASSESGLFLDPQILMWARGRWGAVRPGTAVQPGAPSWHSCLCLAAGGSLPSEHLRDCRQSGDECLLFELFRHDFVSETMEVRGNEKWLILQQQQKKNNGRERGRDKF